MGVDFACRAICPEFLAAEIERRKATLPFGQIDAYDNPLTSGLTEVTEVGLVQVLWPREPGQWKRHWNSGRWQSSIDSMTRLLVLADIRPNNSVSYEAARAAETLYQFVGPFMVCSGRRAGLFNEFGLLHSTILSNASAQWQLRLFQSIDWDALRPVFDLHCRVDERGKPVVWEFDDLKTFIGTWGDVMAQAAASGRTLYIFAT